MSSLSSLCFNLGIEMLFVSSELEGGILHYNSRFQSRNRDAFRFKVIYIFVSRRDDTVVSISESRCFSFQVKDAQVNVILRFLFSISESRCFSFQVCTNRTCLWRGTRRFNVSISESRCFSFQVQHHLWYRSHGCIACFNLGIEMLFVSSAQLPCRSCAYTPRFNLGIEMLFVSRP